MIRIASLRALAGLLLIGLMALPIAGQGAATYRKAHASVLAPRIKPGTHNVILFVADGLRSGIVNDTTAPAMAAVRREGVDFHNSHSLYPTVTTVNGSAIATGHGIGDTGNFGNSIWIGAPVNPNTPSRFAGVEDDDSLLGLDRKFGGNYLHEHTLLAVARTAGFQTAIIGKLGPALEQDHTARDGLQTIFIDDNTGYPGGIPLAPEIKAALRAAGIAAKAEDRGLNGDSGDYIRSGVRVANVQQQDWMTDVAVKVILPRFAARTTPFVMVFWSRDPDGTQHGTGDSLNSLTPGINGPTALAGVKNADNDLDRLRAALKTLGLDRTTDIVVAADHGFSVISKDSKTSGAARRDYVDVPKGFLPQGYVGIDLAKALDLSLFDGAGLPVDLASGFHPRTDGVLLGDPKRPKVIMSSQGGAELFWIPEGPDRKAMVERIVGFLTTQDYTSALFVDDAVGEIPGTLPFSAIGLVGGALTPRPTLAMSFRSFSTGCDDPELCTAVVADNALQQGQGIHGSFSRADTHNFMAAIGPDFKEGFRDPAPVSNADLAPTMAHILGLVMPSKGSLKGRVAEEALVGGAAAPVAQPHTLRSKTGPNGFVTVLDLQTLHPATGPAIDYLDAAGMPGRVVGLRP